MAVRRYERRAHPPALVAEGDFEVPGANFRPPSPWSLLPNLDHAIDGHVEISRMHHLIALMASYLQQVCFSHALVGGDHEDATLHPDLEQRDRHAIEPRQCGSHVSFSAYHDHPSAKEIILAKGWEPLYRSIRFSTVGTDGIVHGRRTRTDQVGRRKA